MKKIAADKNYRMFKRAQMTDRLFDVLKSDILACPKNKDSFGIKVSRMCFDNAVDKYIINLTTHIHGDFDFDMDEHTEKFGWWLFQEEIIPPEHISLEARSFKQRLKEIASPEAMNQDYEKQRDRPRISFDPR